MIESNSHYIARQEERESSARSYPRKFPICVARAKGSRIVDVEGKEYIDFLCGAGTLALGHNDDEVNAAMIGLIKSGALLHGLDLITPAKDDFTTALMESLPEDFASDAKVHFCSPAGTDALDAAIKLCKYNTGRSGVVAFSGAYHGMGQGPLAMMGNLHSKEKIFGLPGEAHFMPAPYSYRCPFGVGGDEGVRIAAEFFERTLKDPESGVVKPACVIIEPIQGEGGVIPMPAQFLRSVRRVTEELGIPLVFDEVQCGIGRSGDFTAFEFAGIAPDVLCLSKAVGGSQPMAVIVYRKALDKWVPGIHAGTFRGNQLAMVAGSVLMKRVRDRGFLDEVKRKGRMFQDRFESLKSEISVIGDVRGRGLMRGIEIVDPKSIPDRIGSKAGSGEIASEIQSKCVENGLIMEKGGRNGAVLRCLAALNIPDEDLERGMDILEKVMRDVDGRLRR